MKRVPLTPTFLFMGLFSLTLLSGLFLPIYSDETVIKFFSARFFFDNAEKYALYAQCTNTLGHATSWFFYPAAIPFSILYSELNPLGLRISGMFLGVFWFIILALWCRKCAPKEWLLLFSLFIMVLSLGTLPYLFIMSRSEQFIILPILILSFASTFSQTKGARYSDAFMLIVMTFLVVLVFYVHPKSIFFAPFLSLVVWVKTVRLWLFLRVGLVLYVFAMTFQVYQEASLIGSCTSAPSTAKLLASYTLKPELLLDDPMSFFNRALSNLVHFPERAMSHMKFSPTFQSGWLPPLEEDIPLLGVLNYAIFYSLSILVVSAHIGVLILNMFSVFRKQFDVHLLLALFLSLANIANASLYNQQSFYEGLQYVSISIIIVLLAYNSLRLNGWRVSFTYNGFICFPLFLLSMVSMISLLYLIAPNIVKNAKLENSHIPNQPGSIPTIGVGGHIIDIRNLGKRCNIPDENAKYLVIDNMTYFPYKRSFMPLHITYVGGDYYAPDLQGEKLRDFLLALGSPGMIARCDNFPKYFENIMIEGERGYCCVEIK